MRTLIPVDCMQDSKHANIYAKSKQLVSILRPAIVKFNRCLLLFQICLHDVNKKTEDYLNETATEYERTESRINGTILRDTNGLITILLIK